MATIKLSELRQIIKEEVNNKKQQQIVENLKISDLRKMIKEEIDNIDEEELEEVSWQGVKKGLGAVKNIFKDKTQQAGQTAGQVGKEVAGNVKQAAGQAAQNIAGAGQAIAGKAQQAGQAIAGKAQQVAQNVKGAATQAGQNVTMISNKVNQEISKITNDISQASTEGDINSIKAGVTKTMVGIAKAVQTLNQKEKKLGQPETSLQSIVQKAIFAAKKQLATT